MYSLILETNDSLFKLKNFIRAVEEEMVLLEQVRSIVSAGHSTTTVDVQSTLNKILPLQNNKKTFVYYASIIRLYGIYEQFIEKIVAEYSNKLCNIIENYGHLPDVMQKEHLNLSLQLINKNNEFKYKDDVSSSIPTIISNLNSCLCLSPDYKLNSKAFAIHTANLWLDQTCAMLKRIGIDTAHKQIVETEGFKEFIHEKFGKALPSTDQECHAALAQLDDLIGRRNEIAHGVSIDDIEDTELLRGRIDFIGVLCNSIHTVLTNDLYKYQIKTDKVTKIGRPIEVYNNHIACFRATGINISLGSKIVARRPDGCCFDTLVESIQVENVSKDSINLVEVTAFGIKLDKPIKKNYVFYLIK